ncbi:MAG TPA: HAD family phosphatase [Candidatus Elarobacter sp.]|nr:HAD family phosphatase [Candidatus Elarobacter sp.]
MARPHLVIFDCDGVLVDSEPVVNAVESAYFATLGYDVDPVEARRRFQGKTVGQVADAIAAAIGHPLDAEALYAWGMTTAVGLVESLQAVPGVRDVIAMVRDRGVPSCVASQSPLPRVRLSLHVTGLAPYFGDHVFTASMVARPKPAPDLFLHAARAMGVDPARCVVIEDSPSGVIAARDAGMTAIGYAADADADALAAAGAVVAHTMPAVARLLALDA